MLPEVTVNNISLDDCSYGVGVTRRRTSTFTDALGRLNADAEQSVWTRLARHLTFEVLVSAGWTPLTRAAGGVVPRRQAARHCHSTRTNTSDVVSDHRSSDKTFLKPKNGLGLGLGLSLGLAGPVLCCETRSCHGGCHNDLEGHSNFSSTIYSFSILCLEHHYCGDQQ